MAERSLRLSIIGVSLSVLLVTAWCSAAAGLPACCSGSGCCQHGEACSLEYGASGTVRDALTHEPIAGALVNVLDASTVTNADGAFEVSHPRNDVCNIDYFFSISVSAPGYERYHSELFTSAVFPRGDILLVPVDLPPTPGPDDPTSTPTPAHHCPSPTPCVFGQQPRVCDTSDPCGLGCGCSQCAECLVGQMLDPHSPLNDCRCIPDYTPTPLADLPDLVPSGAFLGDNPQLPECIDDPGEYITRPIAIGVCIDNRGGAASGPFDVAVDGNTLRFGAVAAHDVACLGSVAHAIDIPSAFVEVDVADEVHEGNEDNNGERLTVPLPPMPPVCSTLARVQIGSTTGAPGANAVFDVTLRTRGDEIDLIDHRIAFDRETPVAARDDGTPDCEANAEIVSGSFEFLPTGCTAADCTAVHVRIQSLAGPLADGSVLYSCTATVTAEPAQTCFHPLVCSDLLVETPGEDPAEAPCGDGSINSSYPREPASFQFAVSPEHPRVGDAVELTVSVSAPGGLPSYTLRGDEPYLTGDPGSVHDSNFHPFTYQLFAAEAGVASLVLSVDYETTVGCPGSTFYQFTGDTSDPFPVEIAPAHPTSTATPGPGCPTATPVVCPTGEAAQCAYPPSVPCLDCHCEACPPCPEGQVFTRANSCDCTAPTPLPVPPGDETDAPGGGGGGGSGGGCAIDDRSAAGLPWWLLATAFLTAVRRRNRSHQSVRF